MKGQEFMNLMYSFTSKVNEVHLLLGVVSPIGHMTRITEHKIVNPIKTCNMYIASSPGPILAFQCPKNIDKLG